MPAASRGVLLDRHHGAAIRARIRNHSAGPTGEEFVKRDIVQRYAHNPILTKGQIPYQVETVHNAAVVKHDGQYIMLFRSHLRTGRSIIGIARSRDGFCFTADPQPFLVPEIDGPLAAY